MNKNLLQVLLFSHFLVFIISIYGGTHITSGTPFGVHASDKVAVVAVLVDSVVMVKVVKEVTAWNNRKSRWIPRSSSIAEKSMEESISAPSSKLRLGSRLRKK